MKRIVIIEDDLIVANIYRNKLTIEGYQVETAKDGEAGFSTVQTFRPDVVILDLMLPKVTGVELIKKIRAEPQFATLPVIVFSNTYLTNMVQEAWKAGATKCLSKANCSPKQVIEVVRSVLSVNGANATAHTSSTSTPRAVAQTAPTLRPVLSVLPPPASSDSDAEFQAELRKSFCQSLPEILASLRASLKAAIKSNANEARIGHIHEIYRRVHALTGNAGITGMLPIAQMSDALEALLKELYEKPKHINASTLRTVASAVDFLGVLFERAATTPDSPNTPPQILVVDDEAISRRAVSYALEKAKLRSISVEDPQVAYNLLLERKFDLIFLDVDMPGMNGFELCTRLRQLPAYKTTPVVFVTSLNDLESRASSTMSGGNDFIAKPFMFIELAVKALVYVLRDRLGRPH